MNIFSGQQRSLLGNALQPDPGSESTSAGSSRQRQHGNVGRGEHELFLSSRQRRRKPRLQRPTLPGTCVIIEKQKVFSGFFKFSKKTLGKNPI